MLLQRRNRTGLPEIELLESMVAEIGTNPIQGLADKAETILNKIDKNTASVLHKPISTEMNIINFDDPIPTPDNEIPEQEMIIIDDQSPYEKQILLLQDELKLVEIEKQRLSKQSLELTSALDRIRLDLHTTRSELDRHKARALKTLQEKEKLITELKSNSKEDTDNVRGMEIDQLRRERESLREENDQLCRELRLAREEMTDTEMKFEKLRQTTTDVNLKAQEVVGNEKKRRLEAEEDSKLHAEELRNFKEELVRQRNNFTVQIQKHNTEITKLRAQLSATATPSSEIESRLTNLTQTLVIKQQAVENLTTERNALKLQLEKLSRRNVLYNNDTDDTKAQLPTFLIETPFDTGVTRRVKRAYTLLDAISVRTGVFLRRYPLARILVLIYMVFLQFWVFVVLFSQSPEAH